MLIRSTAGIACAALFACGGRGGASVPSASGLPEPPPAARTEIDGLPGAEAVAFDSRGNLYAGSIHGTILRVSPRGERRTFAETRRGVVGLAVGPGDEVYATAIGEGEVLALSPDGQMRVVASGLDSPNALAFDANGLLLVSATGLAGRPQIACILPDGGLVTLTQEVTTPNGIAFGPDGRFYVAEILMHRIVRFDVDGSGTFSEPEVYAAGLRFPDGIAFDERGNLFVAGEDAIWVVTREPERRVRRYVTDGDVDGPTSLAFAAGLGRDPGYLFFTNYGHPERGTGSTVASAYIGIPGLRLLARTASEIAAETGRAAASRGRGDIG